MMKENSYPLLSLTLDKLSIFLKKKFAKGEFHAKTIYKEFYRKGVSDFEILPEFSKQYPLPQITVSEKKVDEDVVKFALSLENGGIIETVIIPHKNRNTLCISSQIGCKMGCKFCSTGEMEFLRNLSTEEILLQIYAAKFLLDYPIDNIVFMGMGEPLDNCDSVFEAVRIMKEPLGFAISNRKITISTAGLISGLEKMAASDISTVNKAISLHFADQIKREKYMPIARRYPLDLLRKTMINYPNSNRKLFFIEYIMLKNINDSDKDAEDLIEYLKDLPVKINLIAYNSGEDSKFRASNQERILKFQNLLINAGFVVIFRNSRGSNIQAACGQLSKKSSKLSRIKIL